MFTIQLKLKQYLYLLKCKNCTISAQSMLHIWDKEFNIVEGMLYRMVSHLMDTINLPGLLIGPMCNGKFYAQRGHLAL